MGFCDYGNGALSVIISENLVSRWTAISCLGVSCTVEFVQADPLPLNFHAISNSSLHQIFKFIHWCTINLALYLDSEISFIQIFKYQRQYRIPKNVLTLTFSQNSYWSCFSYYPLSHSAHVQHDEATLSITHSRRFRLTVLEIILASVNRLSEIWIELIIWKSISLNLKFLNFLI